MFLEYFGLVEQPFGVTPDPRFLHRGRAHREALASLIYGTENNRGFLALVAPPGMGKTSLLFQYLENMRNRARTAFLFQSAGDGQALMRYLLYDLGQDPAGKDLPGMHQALNDVLAEEMRAGRQLVLVLDEAQNLSEEALEFVRLLSNFETPWMKLLQIVIAGQPQLTERLARPGMEQLRQRISCFIRLEPFEPEETCAYIDHRLWVAGYSGPNLFAGDARAAIAEISGGIPRNINNICFHAMSLAQAARKKQVDSKMVREAADDSAAGSSVARFTPPAVVQRPPEVAPCRPVAVKTFSEQHPYPRWSTVPILSAPHSVDTSKRRSAITFLGTLLLLVSIFGALWKAGEFVHPSNVTPSVQASVLPAASPAPASPQAPDIPAINGGPGAIHAYLSPGAFAPLRGTAIVAPSRSSPSRSAGVVTVVVESGTTLRHLTLTYLDRYDLPTVSRLCAFNHISDPNQIQIGQTIRIPLLLAASARETRP